LTSEPSRQEKKVEYGEPKFASNLILNYNKTEQDAKRGTKQNHVDIIKW
jgi:hypothetical protein